MKIEEHRLERSSTQAAEEILGRHPDDDSYECPKFNIRASARIGSDSYETSRGRGDSAVIHWFHLSRPMDRPDCLVILPQLARSFAVTFDLTRSLGPVQLQELSFRRPVFINLLRRNAPAAVDEESYRPPFMPDSRPVDVSHSRCRRMTSRDLHSRCIMP